MLRVIENRGTLETAQIVSCKCAGRFSCMPLRRAAPNAIRFLICAVRLKTPVIKHHAYLKAAELPEFLKKLGSL